MSSAGIFWLTIALIVIAFFAVVIISASHDANIMSNGTEAQKEQVLERQAKWAHGELRPQIVCPHCQERGNVRCKAVTTKKGISGGKATGAILTGGVSILATGLSRKVASTEAFCTNCQSKWHF